MEQSTPKFTPEDSLRTLIDTLNTLMAMDGARHMTWYAEPMEYDFLFVRTGDNVYVTVHKFANRLRTPDGRTPYVTVHTAWHDLVLRFWRALRDVQTRHDFEHQWQRRFPHEAMNQLTSRLQAVKRS